MGNVNQGYYDRVRYKLYNKQIGEMICKDVEGWQDDDKELVRHEQYHGVFAQFSNSLKFNGDSRDYINTVHELYDINADIILTKEERNPITDHWETSYFGYLDLSTKEDFEDKISIKFNSGGLEQALKSRESEDVEIDRTTTIDGKIIDTLQPINVELDGRRIFLKSKWQVQQPETAISLFNFSNGNLRGTTTPFPINMINQSHEVAQSPIIGTNVSEGTWDRIGAGEVGLMFMAISDRKRTFRLKFKLNFKCFISQFDDVNAFKFYVGLGKYFGGSAFFHKSRRFLLIKDTFEDINGKEFTINFDEEVTLEVGESLALLADQNASLGDDFSRGHLQINLYDINCELFVDEDSFFEKSETKAILYHEFLDRLVTINTNQPNSFYSEYFGRMDLGYKEDGPGAYVGVTHGFWVRGFDRLPLPVQETPTTPKVENLFKPLTTSLKDALGSADSVLAVGMGIERIGFKERVRVEDLRYFYNKNVTIKLPNPVKNVKRTIAKDKYYSSLEFGYEKGGTYEEACGLDEFNKRNTYTTIINRLKNTYSKISNYRADSYGMEFARRKPKKKNETLDTNYDNDIFWLDLKKGVSQNYVQKKWQDDFEEIPTGVFSPETATNLRFSPVNMLLRHSWYFAGCLRKYLLDYVRYSSSETNSLLTTKLIGKNRYSENGNIINSELSRPHFITEIIEFEHECDFSVMKMINGTSIVLGKEIYNVYGLIEFFTNENLDKERGWLLSLKPNGNGQFKVLKANL